MKMYALIQTEILDGNFDGNKVVMCSTNIAECEKQLLECVDKTTDSIADWYENECGEENAAERMYQFIEPSYYSENGFITRWEIVLKKEKLLNAYYFQIVEI